MKFQRTDAAALFASLLWGINFSSVKIALSYVSPFVMGILRFGIAAIIMVILLCCVERNIRVSRSLLLRMSIAAFIGFGVQQILFLFGANFIDASFTALMTTFTTAIMTVISSFISRERLTRWMIVGVLVACMGMFLAVLGKGNVLALNARSWLGLFLVFASGIVAGFTPIINKKALAEYSSSKVTTWTVLMGMIFFLPLGTSDSHIGLISHLPLIAWVAITFSAVFATAFANIFWNYGIAHVGVVRMTIYGYLPPALGMLLSTVILHDSLTLVQWGGALITLVGVVLSQADKIFQSGHVIEAEQMRDYVEMVSTGQHPAIGKIVP